MPIPFPNCIRGSGSISLRILYNCQKIGANESTSIYVSYSGEFGNNSFIILLNGATGYSNDYEDIFEINVDINEISQLQEKLTLLFSNCTVHEGSLAQDISINQIINQILDQIGDGEESSALFGMKYHYFESNGDLEAPAQFSGNISWEEWQVAVELYQTYGFQYDAANRLTNGKYESKLTRCKITSADYDVSFGYDARGNIISLNRNGFKGLSTTGVPLYGQIDQLQYSYNCNQLLSVTEGSDQNRGYLGSSSLYTYSFGRMEAETGARAATLSYNFHNQPTLIKVSGVDAIRNIWDSDGTLQKQTEYGANGEVLHERLYHDGIEYQDGKIQAIHHGEGQYVFEYEIDGSLKRNYHEFLIFDKLGNVRVGFADLNGDKKINIYDEGPGQEKELLGSHHYYPFGLKMEGLFHIQIGKEYRYQYNGIELLKHANLNVGLAKWRTNDMAICRWWQVDPNAESFYSMSPYNSMANNPVLYNDPDGDILPAMIVGAAISVFTNGINNLFNDRAFFKGAAGAAFFGALGGGISCGIGAAASSMEGCVSQFAISSFQFAAHGLSGGILSVAQGGKFESGFLSGGISSGISSGAQALHLGTVATVGLGGLSGGLGSTLGGDNFIQGFGQGLITSGLNHAVHGGWFGEGPAMSLLTGQLRHFWQPDVSGFSAKLQSLGGGAEAGFLRMNAGKSRGQTRSLVEAGVSAAIPEVSIGSTNYYFAGSIMDLTWDNIAEGIKNSNWEFGVSAEFVSVSYSQGTTSTGFKVYSFGSAVGLSSINIKWKNIQIPAFSVGSSQAFIGQW
jgi:hypothetical protein